MTLDERARRAAAELNRAVGEADLMLFEAGIPALRRETPVTHQRARGLVFAGAFAAVLLFIGLTLVPGLVTAPEEADGDVATEQSISPSGTVAEGDTQPGEPAEPTNAEEVAPSVSIAAADVTPPVILITSPADGADLTSEDIGATLLVSFEGTAEPGSTVVAKTGTDPEPQVLVGDDGRWAIDLILVSGANPVRFQAVDAAGNVADAEITVTYTPDTASTTTTSAPSEEGPPPEDLPADGRAPDSDAAPASISFAAESTYGESALAQPFDVYYGTAEPGAMISVTSAYGGGTTVADELGAWEIRVEFSDAPIDEPFLVTIRNAAGDALKQEFIARTSG